MSSLWVWELWGGQKSSLGPVTTHGQYTNGWFCLSLLIVIPIEKVYSFDYGNMFKLPNKLCPSVESLTAAWIPIELETFKVGTINIKYWPLTRLRYHPRAWSCLHGLFHLEKIPESLKCAVMGGIERDKPTVCSLMEKP